MPLVTARAAYVSFRLVEGNYYLVHFEGELWPGQLIKLTTSAAMVRCLQKAAVVGFS